jgi:molybdopterin/thiamine biosynthesis adenylyltransferase
MTDQLVCSYSDWAALRAWAMAGQPARALVGHSSWASSRRWLVAELLPVECSYAELARRCRDEQLGLLEIVPARDDDVSPYPDSTIASLAGDFPLLLAHCLPRPLAWLWNAAAAELHPMAGICLLGAHPGEPPIAYAGGQPAHSSTKLDPRFERQIELLGTGGQQALSSLHIALVGCGGTGSMVATLCALSFAPQMTLIDDDRIEESNRNRLLMATAADVRQQTPKAMALQRFLSPLTDDQATQALTCSLYDSRAVAAILEADLVVGCTDNEGSRLVLNHLAVQHLLPYVDCGVGIQRVDERLVGGGQVRVVLPGGPCLECFGGIDAWRAADDLTTPRERALHQAHAYGLAERQPVPALAVLNTVIAAEATATIIALATGLRPISPFLAYDFGGPSLRPLDQLVRNIHCPTCSPGARYGRGSSLPIAFPTDTYPLSPPQRPVASDGGLRGIGAVAEGV